jgi:HEAT repeat protein
MYTCRSISGALLLALTIAAHAEDPPPAPARLSTNQGVTQLDGQGLAWWIKELESRDASMRERAISALPYFGSAVGGAKIIDLLLRRASMREEEDASPRVRALQVLNAMEIKTEHAAKVVAGLTFALHDQQAVVRYTAAFGLVRFGSEARSAIPALVLAADDRASWEIRRAALCALMTSGRTAKGTPDPKAVEAMVRASKDPAAEVRLSSAVGLGMLGKTTNLDLYSQVEVTLKNLSHDKDPRVAIWGKAAQMVLGEPTDEDVLSLAGQVRSPLVPVRTHALQALASLGPKAKAAQARVLDALGDKEPVVQFAAMNALVAMDDKAPAVLKALKDVHERKDVLEGIRQAAQAAQDLLEHKERPKNNDFPPADKAPPQAVPKALTELEGKSLSAWLDEMSHNPDPSIRERAISLLPLFGDAVTGTEVISKLLECSQDKDASPRVRALQVLNAMDVKTKAEVKRTVYGLMAKLSDQQALVRYEAALGLVRFGEEAAPAVAALSIAAEDRVSWEIRRAALAALAGAGRGTKGPDPRAVQAMVNRSYDGTAEVRIEAAMGLGALGRTTSAELKPKVEKALLHLIKDKDARVSLWAMVSGMALGGPNQKTADAVAAQIRSRDIQVRVHALRAIGAMGPKGKYAQDKVLDVLNDKEPVVQLTAMAALLAMEDRGANVLNALKELADRKDASEIIRQGAQEAYDLLRKGHGK